MNIFARRPITMPIMKRTTARTPPPEVRAGALCEGAEALTAGIRSAGVYVTVYVFSTLLPIASMAVTTIRLLPGERETAAVKLPPVPRSICFPFTSSLEAPVVMPLIVRELLADVEGTATESVGAVLSSVMDFTSVYVLPAASVTTIVKSLGPSRRVTGMAKVPSEFTVTGTPLMVTLTGPTSLSRPVTVPDIMVLLEETVSGSTTVRPGAVSSITMVLVISAVLPARSVAITSTMV